MKTAYFILGMHRSGTSALAGVLDIMGLEFGNKLMPATEANPKGYFENLSINALNEKILFENNSNWADIYFKVDDIPQELFLQYIEEAKDIILEDFKYAESFVIKDPRIALLFPIWENACLKLGYKIKVILPQRNPLEVAKSLQKRDGFPLEKSLLLWSHHIFQAELLSRNYERLFTTFNDLIQRPLDFAHKLEEFTNFKLNSSDKKEIEDFIDKNIKHNNISLRNFYKETPKFMQDLITLIQNKDFTNKKLFDTLRDEFYFSLDMFHYTEIRNILKEYKSLKEEVTQLQIHCNSLEKIKDPTIFDEEYYKKANSDLEKYEGPLFEHYILYGNKEHRHPNVYSQINKVDNYEKLPTSYLLHSREQEISELHKILDEKVDAIEGLKKNKAELESRVNTLQEEKDSLGNVVQEREAKINELDCNLDEIIEDLELVREDRMLILQKFQMQEQITEEFANKIKEQDLEIVRLANNIQVLESSSHEKEIQLENIQEKYENKLNEVKHLQQTLNEVLEDFIKVKENQS